MSAQAAMYGGMAALQLAGGYFASQNIKDTARLNQDIAEMNAEFAELDAYDAIIAGETQKAKYQANVDQILSEQQARLAATGVDVTYGSVGEIQEETRFISELNKMEIEKQAQEQALGFKRQASQYRFGGFMQMQQAEAEAAQVMFGAVTSAAQTGLTGYARSK